MKRSPRRSPRSPRSTRQTTSTSAERLDRARCCTARRAESAACGCPGVSSRTICESDVVRTPRIWVRVVCGRFETIETFDADEPVHERRLPDVGSPDEADEPGAVARSRVGAARVLCAPLPVAVRGVLRVGVVQRHGSRPTRCGGPPPARCGTRGPGSARSRPASGTWPSRLNTRPPTVSHSVSGSSTPSTSFTSSIGVRPGAPDAAARERLDPRLLAGRTRRRSRRRSPRAGPRA